ncbi:MAG: MFS transporter [Candidatus Tectomicrobia bacterium]|nr:MFS transporter [Candidatus Tectomicrobia bacterium]
MSPSQPTVPLTKGFYGWYVLGAGFIILFFNTGARLSFGVVFKPMIAEFGWDRATLSSAFLLHMTVYALSLVIAGKLYDRYGPQRVIILSTVFLALGYVLTAWINTLWQFWFCYGILAAIGLGGTSVPLIAALMSKWFEAWRGLAISLTLCGSSLGHFVLVPLCTWLITLYDWRTVYLVLGIAMLVVNIVLALWIIRGDPDDLGQQPFGAHKPSPDPASATSMVVEDHPRDLDIRQALRTASFWLFLVAMCICGSGDFMVTTHFIPWVTDHGVSAATGGQMLAWYGLLSLAGLLVAGPASDLIGSKFPIALTFVLRFGLFLLVIRLQTLTSFYIFALAFGFTHLITAPLTPLLVGRLYGLSHIGVIAGLITTVHHLAGGLWAYWGGVIFDRTGSYQLAFSISAITVVVALVSSLLIREHRHAEA